MVSKWCSDNHMAVNTTKTKVMLITTKQKRASLPEHQRTPNVKMEGMCLENISSNKLLRTTINLNFSWKDHINTFVRKINSKLALLKGIKELFTS